MPLSKTRGSRKEHKQRVKRRNERLMHSKNKTIKDFKAKLEQLNSQNEEVNE